MTGKVLLAEDDALTRYMMSEMLEELEIAYEVARNGEECNRLIRRDPDAYALILMDIHMPQKTGVEAVRQIREAEGDPPRNIPIIAVTADHIWQDREKCREAGFSDVMKKPVMMDELGAMMREYL